MGRLVEHDRAGGAMVARLLSSVVLLGSSVVLLGLGLGACVPDITTPDTTPSYVDRMDRARASCRDVPHETSPLEHVDVLAVRPIARFEGRPRVHRVRGARLQIRPRGSMTADALERWSACHIARSDLLMEQERAPHDPLAVRGVAAEVRRGAGVYELWLTAERHDDGHEVYRRALRVLVD